MDMEQVVYTYVFLFIQDEKKKLGLLVETAKQIWPQ
jgi:hypothetical protein